MMSDPTEQIRRIAELMAVDAEYVCDAIREFAVALERMKYPLHQFGEHVRAAQARQQTPPMWADVPQNCRRT